MMVQLSSTLSRALALLILFFILPCSPVSAQVRTLDLREMVQSSGMIFIGTVVQARGATDEHGDIVTYTTFAVDRTIHGNPGKGVTIKQLGGQTQTLGMQLEHMRYFREKERVLIMLYPVSNLGFTSPIGLNQGVWSVGSDGMVQGVSDEALRGLGSLLTNHGLTIRDQQSIPVQTFVALIQDLMQKGGKP